MAAKDGDQLRYVGGVGTGLSSRSATVLKKEIEKIVVSKPAIPMSRKRDALWVEPVLGAEVEYGAGPAMASSGMAHIRGCAILMKVVTSIR